MLNGDITHLSAFADHFYEPVVGRFTPGKFVCRSYGMLVQAESVLRPFWRLLLST
jgi:hypothetical protein